MYNYCSKTKAVTKTRRKEIAEQYADRIERRNSTATVIATATFIGGIGCFAVGLVYDNFPAFLAAFPLVGVAWIAGQTIRR